MLLRTLAASIVLSVFNVVLSADRLNRNGQQVLDKKSARNNRVHSSALHSHEHFILLENARHAFSRLYSSYPTGAVSLHVWFATVSAVRLAKIKIVQHRVMGFMVICDILATILVNKLFIFYVSPHSGWRPSLLLLASYSLSLGILPFTCWRWSIVSHARQQNAFHNATIGVSHNTFGPPSHPLHSCICATCVHPLAGQCFAVRSQKFTAVAESTG